GRAAAGELGQRCKARVPIKAGHLPSNARATNVLADAATVQEYSAPFVRAIRTHGTGCLYSAAITAHLALASSLADAVDRAKRFITRAIRESIQVGKFHALKL